MEIIMKVYIITAKAAQAVDIKIKFHLVRMASLM